MPRSLSRRMFSLLLALVFMAGTGRSVFGLHECLHHPGHGSDAAATAGGLQPTFQAGHHAEHAGHDLALPEDTPGHGAHDPADDPGHGSHADGPCTCLGTCTSAGAVLGVVSSGPMTDLGSITAAHVGVRDGTGRVGPRYARWELPPSTAPPLHLRAIAGV